MPRQVVIPLVAQLFSAVATAIRTPDVVGELPEKTIEKREESHLRLVYIEPYPKSQVARLFRDSIALESPAQRKVLFEPFVGIAPPRFRDFFLMPVRKDDNGRIISWDEVKRSTLPNIESDPRSYIRSERAAVEELGKALAENDVTFRKTSP